MISAERSLGLIPCLYCLYVCRYLFLHRMTPGFLFLAVKLSILPILSCCLDVLRRIPYVCIHTISEITCPRCGKGDTIDHLDATK